MSYRIISVLGARSKQFQDFINKKQSQARNSVSVQVGSEHSFPELFNYCLKFGDIVDCHHYQVKHGHFVLIQFSEETCVNELFINSCSNENSIGANVQSPFLWFKTGKKPTVIKSPQFGKGVLESKFGNTTISDDMLIDKLRNANSIDDQMKKLVTETQLNDLSTRLRFLAANQIEKALIGMFPWAKAYPFGSSVNSFGKMGCDLDIILKLDSEEVDKDSRLVFHIKENSNHERTQKQRHMEAIGDLLHTFLPGIENVRRILQARVPIIKYHHDYLNLEIDLSMNDL